MGATLTIKQIRLKRKTIRKGWLVISVVAYDGLKGVQQPVALPMIGFERKKGPNGKWRPWRKRFQGDGVLIQSFKDNPAGLGYLIVGTTTLTREGANKVMKAALTAGAELANKGGPVAGGIAGAAAAIISAIIDAGAKGKIVGSIQGAEVDDLDADWLQVVSDDRLEATLYYNDDDEGNEDEHDEDEGSEA